MSAKQPTALIADDEPLLRDELAQMLAEAWPALRIIGQARNGREAVAMFEAERPDVCFLDVQMPGLTGVDAARLIGRRAHLVFVTAFDRYALEAFDQGALDYLVKPVKALRLADTVARLQDRLRASTPVADHEALLDTLAEQLARRQARGTLREREPEREPEAEGPADAPLRWIRATVGPAVRLIAVEAVDFLRSDDKYTLIGWRHDNGQAAEALVRMPLKELLAQLDTRQFVQVHRSTVVNLARVSHVVRQPNETADLHLKGRPERLTVSRPYLPLFKQM
ncbi:MAG: LytTR family DNA-binding domain-containing protein [Rubrivivax sp.]|jgi:DNA-binding LytR/AlgR family response regulator|nr:LytTR family DNA-binding domain-containing protein [Rubrivivax sp.]